MKYHHHMVNIPLQCKQGFLVVVLVVSFCITFTMRHFSSADYRYHKL